MTMKFRFGTRSLANLRNVHPTLVEVVHRALGLSTVDFAVVEGVRSIERQRELWAKGRTAPGPKVTWTMKSMHMVQVTGYGHAVDLLPLNTVTGKLDWAFSRGFYVVGAAMGKAAEELGVVIRWGYDWDGDGVLNEKGEYDGPHFEYPLSEALT